MIRFPVALLCALVPLGLLAAPAPVPKPWVTGWDKPVDPLGCCRFRRSGDRLTLTVPGKGGGNLLKARGPLNCPRLLRGVEGDFVAQVRVGGNASTPSGVHGYRRAGLILTDGVNAIGVYRVTSGVVEGKAHGRTHIPPLCFDTARGLGVTRYFLGGPDLGKPAYLRLERRGTRLDVAFSLDGKKWTSAWTEISDLPRKLKVGVFAESTAEGTFKPTFDQFKLSRPRK